MRVDLRLDLDMRCNLQCIYCDNRDLPKEVKATLAPESLTPLLPAINEHCWSVYLSCGGEPTLHPQFRTMLAQFRATLTKPDISMVSNGILLTKDNRKAILDSPISRMLVSVDSHDPHLYARLCGTSAEVAERVFANLEAFAIERKQVAKPPHLIVTAIAMKSTLALLPDLAKWLRSIGVSCFNVQWLNPLHYEEMQKEVLDPNSFEVREVLAEIKRVLHGSSVILDWPRERSMHKAISVWHNRKLFRNRAAYLENAVRKFFAKKLGYPCVHANNAFYLHPTGDINACPRGAGEAPLPRTSQDLAAYFKTAPKALRKNLSPACEGCRERL